MGDGWCLITAVELDSLASEFAATLAHQPSPTCHDLLPVQGKISGSPWSEAYRFPRNPDPGKVRPTLLLGSGRDGSSLPALHTPQMTLAPGIIHESPPDLPRPRVQIGRA